MFHCSYSLEMSLVKRKDKDAASNSADVTCEGDVSTVQTDTESENKESDGAMKLAVEFHTQKLKVSVPISLCFKFNKFIYSISRISDYSFQRLG